MTKIYSASNRPIFTILLFALLSPLVNASSLDIYGPSTAKTTRYWDCCKPSCGWSDKASFVGGIPIQSCDIHDKPLLDNNQGTGCNGGNAFACATQSPWAVNDTFSYGFSGAFLLGGDETSWCGSCYLLDFTSGPVAGKSMIVQASNTNYDFPTENVFTLGIPGGNTSYFKACALQYGVSNSVFGTVNEGVSQRSDCANLPTALQAGCTWRFDWFMDADGPNVNYKRVECPVELTNITKSTRTDDTTFQTAAAKATNGSPASTVPPIAYTAASMFFAWGMLQILA